ncbi:uncharacterized protein LOC120256691 [Dioscorea cayenensis subsp. rotundata]|uniref:Uncharacterized protein LOC120256691 n=1 Tax=Dioscorea cayennensis subsp. rotundata TaxID=55577 RepID=A0AB40AZQ6_DIOCR|nr:uncharacterized protein LOC120256691 [Dioscorea cayenensis subsp. rotundata]
MGLSHLAIFYKIHGHHVIDGGSHAAIVIVIGWNSVHLIGSIASRGAFSVSVDFFSKKENFHWRCTSVYGPNVRQLKAEFWEEIRGRCPAQGVPWVVGGDFNAIFALEDKSDGPPNLRDIRDASSFLNDLSLFEPPTVGRRFTWSNGQVNPTWVKLDRFIVNRTWAEMFPRLIQNCLPRLGSDHVPIRLEVGMHCSNPRPFRFELAWNTVDGFAGLISQWWNSFNPQGCEAFVLSKKLQWLRDKLRVWSKESFGSIKLRKLALLHELEFLDITKESSLGEIRKQEELYWKQRSRLRWLQEGDENTKYFHSVANGRKNTNFIPSVKVGEVSVSEVREIGKVFENQFRALFGQQRPFRFKADLNRLLRNKARVDLSHLERPFSMEEVKKAVFDLGSDKAPGPDGFPMMFFKIFWEIVKVEVLKLCEDFYSGEANLERYVRYQRGLRQGDPLSPLLFVLITDVLSTLFENALSSHILVGIPVGDFGSICNLHYADDLLILTTGGPEDLRIIKLILLMFEGLSGLETNFAKTCLFSTNMNQLPDRWAASTFSCAVGRLPVHYLGIPISGRRPRKQDWRNLIDKIKGRLSSWKSNYLSISGRLTLLNSVLSSLPTYWMSIFRLPRWVIKDIDRARRDFLWSGHDIDIPKCRLVAWQNICRSKEQGGWGILDLYAFNRALLGKWRWKFLTDSNWCCAKVIKFNYNLSSWNLFCLPRGRVSFFWSGVLKGFSAFNGCVTVKVCSGMESLFWKDRWLNGRAPMHLWPNEFSACSMQNATMFDLRHLLNRQPFSSDHEFVLFLANRNFPFGPRKDLKLWSLTVNRSFSVKSFYDRLNDGGLRCPIAKFFWKGPCPRKVNIFNWLVWKDKILTLENLAKRRCNKLPTATCVLCHEAVESVDHLFLQCRFFLEVWAQISRVLQLPSLPSSMSFMWGAWRNALRAGSCVVGDGAIKAFVWAIWLTRNDVIFSDKCVCPHAVVVKTDHFILSWFSAASEGLRSTLEDSISSIQRSLEFTGPQSEGAGAAHTTEEAMDMSVG